MRRNKANYVNNREFTDKIMAFVAARRDDDTITLRIHENGEYIGLCILEICINLAKKANFAGYTYKDEMISDAVENCVKASMNFNHEKSKNAFGYFTQVAFHAFIRRISKEKIQSKRKLQLLSDPKALNEIMEKQFDRGPAGSEHEGNIQHFVDQMQGQLIENDQLVNVEQKMPRKRKIKEIAISPISKLLGV